MGNPIDEKLARQYWPKEDPIGKRIQPMSGEGWYTIVGIVGHVIQSDLAADTGRGVYYVSLNQRPMPVASILVKASGDVPAAAAAIRDAVRAADPNLPLYDMKTMEALLAYSLAPRQFAMRLLGFLRPKPFSWQRSAFTESLRTRLRSARGRSASASRWAPRGAG